MMRLGMEWKGTLENPFSRENGNTLLVFKKMEQQCISRGITEFTIMLFGQQQIRKLRRSMILT